MTYKSKNAQVMLKDFCNLAEPIFGCGTYTRPNIRTPERFFYFTGKGRF